MVGGVQGTLRKRDTEGDRRARLMALNGEGDTSGLGGDDGTGLWRARAGGGPRKTQDNDDQ